MIGNRKRWLSVLAWIYRATVVTDFLLVASYELTDLDPRRAAPWIIVNTAFVIIGIVFFAARSVRDRTARNDLYLGLFWLVCASFVVFHYQKEPDGIRVIRTR